MGKTSLANQPAGETKRKRRPRRVKRIPAQRVMISLPVGLLEMVDKAARDDFTSRSDIIRMAVLWYLRPQGRDLNQADPEAILKTLQHRQARAALKKLSQ